MEHNMENQKTAILIVEDDIQILINSIIYYNYSDEDNIKVTFEILET